MIMFRGLGAQRPDSDVQNFTGRLPTPPKFRSFVTPALLSKGDAHFKKVYCIFTPAINGDKTEPRVQPSVGSLTQQTSKNSRLMNGYVHSRAWVPIVDCYFFIKISLVSLWIMELELAPSKCSTDFAHMIIPPNKFKFKWLCRKFSELTEQNHRKC